MSITTPVLLCSVKSCSAPAAVSAGALAVLLAGAAAVLLFAGAALVLALAFLFAAFELAVVDCYCQRASLDQY